MILNCLQHLQKTLKIGVASTALEFRQHQPPSYIDVKIKYDYLESLNKTFHDLVGFAFNATGLIFIIILSGDIFRRFETLSTYALGVTFSLLAYLITYLIVAAIYLLVIARLSKRVNRLVRYLGDEYLIELGNKRHFIETLLYGSVIVCCIVLVSIVSAAIIILSSSYRTSET